jgi:hypothetical protein
MKNLTTLTNGQTFTNGTTSTKFQLLDIKTFLVKNLESFKESNLTSDTHVYNVSELLDEKIYIDYEGNKVSLTENEKELINQLDLEIFESGAIVYLDELQLTYSTKVGRGVLSSLIKKNVCCEHEGMIGYSMDKY